MRRAFGAGVWRPGRARHPHAGLALLGTGWGLCLGRPGAGARALGPVAAVAVGALRAPFTRRSGRARGPIGAGCERSAGGIGWCIGGGFCGGPGGRSGRIGAGGSGLRAGRGVGLAVGLALCVALGLAAGFDDGAAPFQFSGGGQAVFFGHVTGGLAVQVKTVR